VKNINEKIETKKKSESSQIEQKEKEIHNRRERIGKLKDESTRSSIQIKGVSRKKEQ
jgi:hypothetical protein